MVKIPRPPLPSGHHDAPEEIEWLAAALDDEDQRYEASNILRSLIDEIRMIPDPATPARHEIELVGDLAGVLHLMHANNKKKTG